MIKVLLASCLPLVSFAEGKIGLGGTFCPREHQHFFRGERAMSLLSIARTTSLAREVTTRNYRRRFFGVAFLLDSLRDTQPPKIHLLPPRPSAPDHPR